MTTSWPTLVQLGGRPPTHASAGYELRATGIQALVRAAHDYLGQVLSNRFEPIVVVPDPTDWASYAEEGVPYGIPYASDEGLDLWVPADVHDNFLVDTYARFGPRGDAERFADLIAVHELGHLHVREMGLHLPTGWLGEFLATYLAYCFLADSQAEDAAIWTSLSRAHVEATIPENRSLETLDELYFGVGADNYIWYQNELTLMVERVHATCGVDFPLRLRSAGLGPDSEGPAMLAAAELICPGFQTWASTLRG